MLSLKLILKRNKNVLQTIHSALNVQPYCEHQKMLYILNIVHDVQPKCDHQTLCRDHCPAPFTYFVW